MSTLQLTLPQSIQAQGEALAQKEGISVTEFVTLAVAEKLATLATADYLAERAKRESSLRGLLTASGLLLYPRRQHCSPSALLAACKAVQLVRWRGWGVARGSAGWAPVEGW